MILMTLMMICKMNRDLRVLSARSKPSGQHPVSILPEHTKIIFPSMCVSSDNPLRDAELRFQINCATQHLTNLREMIAEKSFHYSHVIRDAPNKGMRTRSRSIIKKINEKIALTCRLYARCRNEMIRLRVNEHILAKFQILHKEDVKASTAILNPNQIGSSSVRLSWIWQTHFSQAGNSNNSPESVNECWYLLLSYFNFNADFYVLVQRVHWLRSRAQKNRWFEERVLVGYEMQWTVRYFLHRSSLWEERARITGQGSGAVAYATRQSALWYKLAADADHLYSKFNHNYTRLVK
jgi:hypothetical protein